MQIFDDERTKSGFSGMVCDLCGVSIFGVKMLFGNDDGNFCAKCYEATLEAEREYGDADL